MRTRCGFSIYLVKINNKFMKKPIIYFVISAIIFASQAQNKVTYATIEKLAKKVEPKVIEWRHHIHQNPELSNREFKTAEMVTKHLKSLGIEVQTGVAHTGVVGLLKGGKPGPVVALRADMDALPVVERVSIPWASKAITTYEGVETGVMHACGHDTHVAILMGVAEMLSSMRADLKGTVKFIFQPAEESAPKGEEGGAELMVKEGVMENPKVDVIFGLHINSQQHVGHIDYRPDGIYAAVNDMKITVKGKSAHGAKPWLSVDPVVTAAQIITNLQTVVSRNVDVTKNAAVVTIGSIHGGNRSNIIPEQVEMLGTVRTLSESDQALVKERINQIVTHTAQAMGAEAIVELPYAASYPVTLNDEKLTAQVLPTLERVAGKDNVHLVPPETGAEDFSFFANLVPGFYFKIGGCPVDIDLANSAPHHTPDFYVDDAAMMTGLLTMTNLVIDYMAVK